MTTDQIVVFAILGLALVFFMWGRWRFDFVAFAALIAGVFTGIVPTDEAFEGFGHPAVITVAAVLIISRALQISGAINYLADVVLRAAKTQFTQMSAMSSIGAALSAFMNNVGALALMMPLALRIAERPSAVLMPLSFGTILGGLVTLIGTPPNIIVATFRRDTGAEAFSMFDFAPVGLPVALIGLGFVLLIGWRLIPKNRTARRSAEEMFEVDSYIVEARVSEDSDLVGKPVSEVETIGEHRSIVVGLLRSGRRQLTHIGAELLRADDILLIRADPTSIDDLIKKAGLELSGGEELEGRRQVSAEEIGLMEAVVPQGAPIEGRSADHLALRRRFGVALLALAREGSPERERLSTIPIRAGDVLLLQGEEGALAEAVASLGCLPLAQRGLTLGRSRAMWIPVAAFACAIFATAMGWMPVHISFAAAIVVLVMTSRITMREAYEAIDWPVIVLLGAMIPLGNALQSTGGTQLIATGIVGLAGELPVWLLLALVMIVTMTLSDLMNNAATAIVMAPIAIAIASQLGVSADPFLMATALGASCAFLTPIGHQNNVLVMGPGGYHFGDYWRMGLPLEIIIVATGVPLILMMWPL